MLVKLRKRKKGYKTMIMFGDGATDLDARANGPASAFIGYGAPRCTETCVYNRVFVHGRGSSKDTHDDSLRWCPGAIESEEGSGLVAWHSVVLASSMRFSIHQDRRPNNRPFCSGSSPASRRYWMLD